MFFFDESRETFQMFSLSHLLGDAFWVLAIVLLVLFRKKLRSCPKCDRVIRIFLAVAMLTLQTIFYIWTFWRGTASLELLPFGLCHLAMYLSAITLLTESKTLFKIVFPWAIIGALLSLTIADLTFEFPHFRYIHYFGNHGMFLFGNLYLVLVKGFRMNYKDFWFSGAVLIGLSIPVYFFNRAFDTNHLFLMHAPGGAETAFAFIGDWWLVALIALVFVLYHLIYLPFYLASHAKKRSPS